ncbi:MAG: hypothetical protein ACP59X_18365 [Solidesulfovibrio sp. DCME]|uniref:hypothetical protein n=1 Tax=Solidesulfovibrio sp. DCME TaxID=3447380 RepID=UPI003D113D03
MRSLVLWHRYRQNKKFISSYLNWFVNWIKNYAPDDKDYLWLIEKSVKVQDILGVNGYVKENGEFYQFIPNVLPKIIKLLPVYIQQTQGVGALLGDSIRTIEPLPMIDDVRRLLVQYMGIADVRISKLTFVNIYKLFFDGLEVLLALPANCLFKLGLVNKSAEDAIAKNAFYRIIFVFGLFLIGFYSNLVTIITGNEAFLKKLFEFFSTK